MLPPRDTRHAFDFRRVAPRLPAPLRTLLERVLLGGVNALHARAAARMTSPAPRAYCQAVIEQLGVRIDADPRRMSKVPRTGPLVVVANHPFGGVEGMVLPALLYERRPDVRMLMSDWLAHVPELQGLGLFVNVFGRRVNGGMMKAALRHLRGGGCLAVFPAGEVSSWEIRAGRVVDPSWNAHIAAMIRRTHATVVPMFFHGRNGWTFQLAGMIHPRLRTALLPRIVPGQKDLRCRVEVGAPIRPHELPADDHAAIEFLRSRTYALAHRKPSPEHHRALAVIEPGRKASTIDGARLDDVLARSGPLAVHLVPGEQLGPLADELGRLRELTFRAVGEGTGRSRDLDRFDTTARHLLLWDHAAGLLVGGYRLSPLDDCASAAAYLTQFFDFAPPFAERLGPVIELGRSFVREEYQRGYAPLMLLWRGIAGFLRRHPSYRTLIGTMSMSPRYTVASRAAVDSVLSRSPFRSELSDLVRPHTPPRWRGRAFRHDIDAATRHIGNIDALDRLIADFEPDGRGLPVLFKHYLRLGARTLAVTVDADFGHTLDVLTVLDLRRADRRALRRYTGHFAGDDLHDASGRIVRANVSRGSAGSRCAT